MAAGADHNMALNFHIPGVPFKLTAADMGVPDITKSLTAGIKNAYLPQKQAAELLKMRLANQFQIPRSQRADQFAAAELQQKQAEPYLTLAQAQDMAASGNIKGAEALIKQFIAYKTTGNHSVETSRVPGTSVYGQQQNQSQNEYSNNQEFGRNNETELTSDQAYEIVKNRPENTYLREQDDISPNMLPGNERKIGNFNIEQERYNNKERYPNVPQPGMQQAGLNNKPEKYGWGQVNPTGLSQIPGGEEYLSPIEKRNLEISQNQLSKEVDLGREDAQKASQNSQNSIISQANVDRLIEQGNELNLLQKGPIFGNIRATSSAAQEYDAALATAVNDQARLFQDGTHITDATRIAAQLSKSPRTFTDEARSDSFSFMTAMNQRQKDLASLEQILIAKEVPKSARERLKTDFNTQRPFFNSDVMGRNAKFEGTYRDYTSPQAIQAAINGQDYTPPNQESLEEEKFSKKRLREIAEEVRNKNPTSPYRKVDAVKKRLRDRGLI